MPTYHRTSSGHPEEVTHSRGHTVTGHLHTPA